MDTFSFIASLIGSLAWPVAAIGSVAFLRKPIVNLLGRATSAEGFGAKLTFKDEIEAVREIVQNEPVSLPAPLQLPPPDGAAVPASREQEVIRELTEELSTTTAIGSIIAAWVELESGLRSIASLNGVDWNGQNFTRNINNMRERELIPSNLLTAIKDLRRLRNEVAHGMNPNTLSLADAAVYRSTVREILQAVGFVGGTSSWR